MIHDLHSSLTIGSSGNPVHKEPASVRKTQNIFDTDKLKTATRFGS